MPTTGRRPERRPTLKSVALEAGVSVSTASLVFSGNGPVADATRRKVLQAASRLGYSGPDPLGASLRRGRADVVGVVVPGSFRLAFDDPYARSMADGLASELERMGSAMLLLPHDYRTPLKLLDRLRTAAVDGLVFMGPGNNAVVPQLATRGLPMAGLGAYYDDPVTRIDIDNHAGMLSLTRYLRGIGHHRVAAVSLPLTIPDLGGARTTPRPLAEVLTDVQLLDLGDRLSAVGDVFGPQLPTVVSGGLAIDDAAAAIAPLLDLDEGERPTAVVALSDQLAMGVIRAATERGLRVPEDLSVTGFDGIPQPLWPGELTTVVQPGAEKGVRAARAIAQARDGGRPESVVLPCSLRVGTSTAPLRS